MGSDVETLGERYIHRVLLRDSIPTVLGGGGTEEIGAGLDRSRSLVDLRDHVNTNGRKPFPIDTV